MRCFAGKIWTAGAVLAGAGILTLLLFFYSPENHSFYPRCAFYTVTGLQCPGCGGLRCIHHLLHGRVAMAFEFNALILILLPFTILGGSIYLLGLLRGHPLVRVFENPNWIWILVVVTVAFGIFRNLPLTQKGPVGANREPPFKRLRSSASSNLSAGLQG